MVIIIALILLFIIFFFLRKNIGVSLLATIAGLSIYEMFGTDLAAFLSHAVKDANQQLIEVCIYLILVVGLPLMLYIRSSKGGLFGIMRIAEAAVFATLLVSLCSSQIAYFFPFDQISHNILAFIDSIKGWVLAGGITAAYLDIVICHEI